MITFALISHIIVLIAVPVAIGLWFNRRWRLSWFLFFGGSLAFVAAWVVTSFLALGGVLGLLASSITQMAALYLIYRYQLRTVRTEREALMVGTGLGGIELILMSVLALLTLMQMRPLRRASNEEIIRLAAQLNRVSEEEVRPADLDELRDLIDAYWNRPDYEPFLQMIQPLTFLPIQMVLAIITLAALIQQNLRPLLGAMSIHFLTRVTPSLAVSIGGTLVALALSLFYAGVALWFLYRLWPTAQKQNAAAQAERKLAQQT